MQRITLQEMKAVKLMNRTDTKFVTSRDKLATLLSLVDNEYYVQETNGKTIAPYHTLYYDTQDCRMYLVHHNGKKLRQKLRVRSYVDSDLHFLEVKTKDNHGKTRKKRVDVKLPELHESESLGELIMREDPLKQHEEFLEEHLWLPSEMMNPRLENNFQRMTLVNKQKTERLTIDSGLEFDNPETGLHVSLDHIVIIELKRDSLCPSPILPYLNRLRIFSMGFSKYCMGMALTTPMLKQNRFKERLRLIEKM